jgi:RimJ/RimL family protein N-acetyltransferase
MEEKILIRKATLADLPILLEFEQGIIEAERPFDETLKSGKISYYDLSELIKSDDACVVVAEFDSEIVSSGYAKIKTAKPYLDHDNYVHLGFMFTSPDHRGKKINGLIIDALKKWSVSKNVFEIRLEVYDENLQAIRAYERVGFKKDMVTMRIRID